MATETAILAEGLTKHYGDVHALVDLDLDVKRGEVFGFLGPNGAGKTTAIRTLLDEIRPTAGRASIVGLDTHADSVEIRHHIGYVPGDLAMYPGLTGRDTINYFANLRGGVDWSYVDELAERLNADLSPKVGNLSSGNRQKVGLIQAFMSCPEVLIMDEPSSGLDPLVQREFQTILRELAAEGNTVFLSSHTLSEVQRVADRVGIIRQGRLITVETVSSLRSKAIRRVEFEFGSAVEPTLFEGIDGVRDVVVEDRRITMSYDGTMDVLLKVAMDHNDAVVDINTHEADLEDIFLTYYRVDGESSE
ncbi:MAG TPA: ABC transporter ATP-binding protein [Dehalococcoidia bacterium]|jgi:ABC-2 type transport system ATP-binding protein|nr:ABC transporter [Chloroflexota bacterium]MDP6057001.1 ABC transporter ATP-binding protein [Dehalococcoidia bacterium]MDP7262683.1 ABC transporter ATP-binding protein [Dehalococcoidia bacterium]MDP7485902.1 ABC transporter ATP-binding protein [Dehalococcoidia bacterium]HJP28521.1 ABC transporter ATP-binding protein [Dehalococcoidia bacterium]|tara:strand:+ start:2759 stop:3673 length:915 start_codon:yes stop_codon:yes gene_type:complete